MWLTIAKFLKNVGKSTFVAFTGYEIGSKFDNSKDNKIIKETVTITKENSSNINIENVALIVLLMVCLGIVFAVAQQLVKCVSKRNNNSNNNGSNNGQSNVNIEMQPAAPRVARREV